MPPRPAGEVVVVTIDPARRLADALGLANGLTGEPQRIPSDTGDGELWAMMLDAEAMFERVVRANATEPEQADRIVANRFYRNMSSALSGTQEYMASEALHELHGDERFDLVVVDTPPTRNAIEFLEAPGVLTRFLDHPVFKLMMAPDAHRSARVQRRDTAHAAPDRAGSSAPTCSATPSPSSRPSPAWRPGSGSAPMPWQSCCGPRRPSSSS